MNKLSDKNNSLWLSIQFAFLLVSSLATLKLNLHHFGKEQFGVWILISSVWGLSSTIDFGFGTSVIKYVAEYKDDLNKINRILSSSFLAFLVIGIILFIVGNLFCIALYLNDSKIVLPELKSMYFIITILAGLSFLLQYFALFFKATIDGTSNFVFTSKIAILQTLITLLGVILISVMNLNMIMLVCLYVLASLFMFTSYFSFFLLRIKQYRISIKYFDLHVIKEVLRFSLSVQAMSVFNAVIDPIIKYIIGNYYSLSSVSSYEIARRFAIAISGLFFNAFKIILPKASALKDNDEKEIFINDSLIKYSGLGISYSGIVFGIFSLPIILFMYMVFNSSEAILLFVILALPESINNFGYAVYNFLLGAGKVTLLVLVQLNNLFCVILSLVIGFVLFHNILGLGGYFISVTIGNLLMLLYLRRKWNVNLIGFLVRCGIPKLIGLLVIMFSSVLVLYTNLIPIYMIYGIVSLLSLFIFGSDIKAIFNQLVKPMVIKQFS